jgi:hypothetical protein
MMAEIPIIIAPIHGTVRTSDKNTYVGTMGIQTCIGIFMKGKNGSSMTHLAPYGIGSFVAVGQAEQIDRLLIREKKFLGTIDKVDIAYNESKQLADVAAQKAKEFCGNVECLQKIDGNYCDSTAPYSAEHAYIDNIGGDQFAFLYRSRLNADAASVAGHFLSDALPEIAYSQGNWQKAPAVAPEVALIAQNLLLQEKNGKYVYALDAAEKILERYPDCWLGLNPGESNWSKDEKIREISDFLVDRARDLESCAREVGKPLDPCSSFDAGHEKSYGKKVSPQSSAVKLQSITGGKEFNAYHVTQKIDTGAVDAVWNCGGDSEASKIHEALKAIGVPALHRDEKNEKGEKVERVIVCNVNDNAVASKIAKAYERHMEKNKNLLRGLGNAAPASLQKQEHLPSSARSSR